MIRLLSMITPRSLILSCLFPECYIHRAHVVCQDAVYSIYKYLPNKLPHYVVTAQMLNRFKNKLDDFLLKQMINF